MRRGLFGAFVVAIVAVVALFAISLPAPFAQDSLKPRPANLANGETLFHIGGCAACHTTPKQDDRLRLGGGLALHSPFGTFRAPNISPDTKAGIGTWTEAQFLGAMLKGVGRNGEHLYPSFPYTSYQRMSVDDVRDLFAFLRTLPADPTPSQPHAMSFPFNIRAGLGLWKLIYLDGQPFRPDPAKDAVVNRGAYLVEGPGHCAECHSRRGVLGGIDPAHRFAGGPNPEGKGWVANITPHEDGLAAWSVDDLTSFLATGLAPEGYAVAGSMGEVIENTAKLSAEDRRAMAAYLKSLPPRAGRKPKVAPAG